ncbi:hypothetical protein NY2A_b351R [Paramecium bursaria Chlorella virus NY2A]|uniref:Uncharacterized protein b351R n=1 Tax=Paramecium bursaria Chlorella virus NY2A TaxID=46021 RepID=A7IWM6_PBCVN|nr:hypothetical protein NY2A_b351R [Paramecium bursaria Chlorella virus NY2A]ABT14750.1 hypothetical protein NY2A_b351R [Paramecium bursaria Chlorella virus NY2A]
MFRIAAGFLSSLSCGFMLFKKASAVSNESARSSFFLDFSNTSMNVGSCSVLFKNVSTVSTDSFLRSLYDQFIMLRFGHHSVLLAYDNLCFASTVITLPPFIATYNSR